MQAAHTRAMHARNHSLQVLFARRLLRIAHTEMLLIMQPWLFRLAYSFCLCRTLPTGRGKRSAPKCTLDLTHPNADQSLAKYPMCEVEYPLPRTWR